ncbi:HNH endonuclease [Thermus islandicus]|uniref:HNH endonuclease n=1 Tax=Thermus islandicus TaxID=540988 RepID=UPI0003B752BC|nr:HNH endonuclease signature motif containing protein [Thermus islandicus]
MKAWLRSLFPKVASLTLAGLALATGTSVGPGSAPKGLGPGAIPVTGEAQILKPPLLPDPAKTPGDVLTQDPQVVCVKGYSRQVRNVPPALKRAVYRAYGIEKAPGEDWEVDHLIPLELGGSNSVRNLWPQAGFTRPWNYHVKDRLENALHHLVCRGELPLPLAQRAIAKDWIATFRVVCGDPETGCREFAGRRPGTGFGRGRGAFHLPPSSLERLRQIAAGSPLGERLGQPRVSPEGAALRGYLEGTP